MLYISYLNIFKSNYIESATPQLSFQSELKADKS
jgi:hypothetical protein